MKTEPLLSILIATKDREFYCIESIKSILNFNSDIIEICISDNSKGEQIKDFVNQLNSDAIKYIHTDEKISFIENFNRCMGLASGKYVTLIGDDDTILKTTIDYTVYADNNNIDSISSNNNISYYWPRALEGYPEGYEIITLESDSDKIEEFNPKKYLSLLLDNGLQHYLLYPFPRTYHGIVKREKLIEVKQKTGHFFGGLSPDIYSSISLSCIIEKHYVVGTPLSIAGVCAKSASASNIRGEHAGEMSQSPLLNNISDYKWSIHIPYFYSVNTIWAESAMKALEDMGESSLIKKFNKYRLIAHSTINNRKSIPKIIKRENNLLRKASEQNIILFNAKMAKEYFVIVKNKLELVIKNKLSKKKSFTFTKVNTISDAIANFDNLSKNS
ncbi:glycosyltransferase involved in cell wall biosynthesis [Chryseobacterium sp. H1D6B]|uniref:glycosyltransferase family 2 protein n=1 Tax=Chryseobacterium sp. H1D6B TaxID=2940588 RepID=UPI0015C76108|nr:glycosyltransferase [Chryseobacterium sp. H1D6B]MDH6250683.1 glycosyltransferase involved in cell wall biosynthesis [Chryseobacterium sp. H1D6B]